MINQLLNELKVWEKTLSSLLFQYAAEPSEQKVSSGLNTTNTTNYYLLGFRDWLVSVLDGSYHLPETFSKTCTKDWNMQLYHAQAQYTGSNVTCMHGCMLESQVLLTVDLTKGSWKSRWVWNELDNKKSLSGNKWAVFQNQSIGVPQISHHYGHVTPCLVTCKETMGKYLL